uniref:Uncharacterized protein n=1 Tax=Arundo donax TaxID=35708 RepID=A0A0A9GQ50_ARUDO
MWLGWTVAPGTGFVCGTLPVRPTGLSLLAPWLGNSLAALGSMINSQPSLVALSPPFLAAPSEWEVEATSMFELSAIALSAESSQIEDI